jgi:hypothetical protein
MYFALGTQYLKKLTRKKDNGDVWGLDREYFLNLLERDLLDHIHCQECSKFHTIKKAHRYLYPKISRCCSLKCWASDCEWKTGLYIHEDFSSTIFEMVKKRYRQGLNCSDLLRLLSLKTKTHFRQGYVEQQSALAKIVDGNLLIREQKRFVLPPSQPV